MGKGGDDSGSDAAAAQERANKKAIAEQRRQFDITQHNLQPFIAAERRGIPAQEFARDTQLDANRVARAKRFELNADLTPERLDRRLGQIFGSESFQNLRDERTRALEGQLASSGLRRSGTALQEAANIPTGLGFEIEQLLTGRKEALANVNPSAANATATTNLAQFGGQVSGNISNLLQSTGAAQSSGILADQQSRAAGAQSTASNIISGATLGSAIPGVGTVAGGIAGGVAGLFFSDPALKENVEEIGQAGDLKLYQWDWIGGTKDTIISKCGNIGYMADEVKEKYPQHVYDFSGFMMIDYPALQDELEEKFCANIS
jgi:gas vesicle protein